jgi:hypothetical protein
MQDNEDVSFLINTNSLVILLRECTIVVNK